MLLLDPGDPLATLNFNSSLRLLRYSYASSQTGFLSSFDGRAEILSIETLTLKEFVQTVLGLLDLGQPLSV